MIRSAAGAHFRLPVYNSIEWDSMEEHLEKNSSIFVADSNAKVFADEDTERTSDSNKHHNMPVLPYYGVQFAPCEHVTLIIGGETEGISKESYS